MATGRTTALEHKLWDKKVRQWDRNWIEYDQFYRPIIFNPFRAPVRIVYALANATRILVIQPLERVIVDVAELAAYSFTAVVLGAANVVSDVANVAADVVNVAVGTIFGGGFVPGVGAPFVPPPPLLRYDNVPVQVRYSNATYRAVPGQPDRRRRRRRPVRRAEGVARRSDAGVGAVDHIADRRAAVRGASHAAVPRTRRTARGAAARRLPDAVGVRRVRQLRSHADVSDRGGRAWSPDWASAPSAGPPPRASRRAAVMAPAGVLDNCPALQLIPAVERRQTIGARP